MLIKDYYPKVSENVTIIPSCKLAGPVVNKIFDKNLKTQMSLKIKLNTLSITIEKIKFTMTQGDLIVVPAEEQDADSLVKDPHFFFGFEKLYLAREAFKLVKNNLTLKEIEEDEELMDELAK